MAGCITSEAAQDQLRSALDLIDSGLVLLRETPSGNVGNAFRVEVAERLETQRRAFGRPVVSHVRRAV